MKAFFYTLLASNVYGLPQATANGHALQNILQLAIAVAGALALLFITISGFRYVISSGNPERVAKAKNGIIFSLVGLIACVLAEAIVAFVLGRF